MSICLAVGRSPSEKQPECKAEKTCNCQAKLRLANNGLANILAGFPQIGVTNILGRTRDSIGSAMAGLVSFLNG